jgi:hypothetical protein
MSKHVLRNSTKLHILLQSHSDILHIYRQPLCSWAPGGGGGMGDFPGRPKMVCFKTFFLGGGELYLLPPPPGKIDLPWKISLQMPCHATTICINNNHPFLSFILKPIESIIFKCRELVCSEQISYINLVLKSTQYFNLKV